MPRYCIKSFLFFVLIFASSILRAQSRAENIAGLSIPASTGEIHPGDTLQIPVKISLQKGWHINSDKPEEDFLIATKLKIDSDSDTIKYKVIYPKPDELKSEFSEKPVPVFNSGSILQCTVYLPENFSKDKITLNFELEYQACNNNTCTAPETAIYRKEFEIKKK